MWIETHKLQFAELQEGGELHPTSSHLAPPWRVWKRDRGGGGGEQLLGLPPVGLGLLETDSVKTMKNLRMWKQGKWLEVAVVLGRK